jgi:hypothetical protein
LAENGFSVINQIDVGPYHYELICKPTVDYTGNEVYSSA